MSDLDIVRMRLNQNRPGAASGNPILKNVSGDPFRAALNEDRARACLQAVEYEVVRRRERGKPLLLFHQEIIGFGAQARE